MGDALFSDRLLRASPSARARARPRPPLAELPARLATMLLGGLVLAMSLLAIGFCLVPG